jgi:hypothetical protein
VPPGYYLPHYVVDLCSIEPINFLNNGVVSSKKFPIKIFLGNKPSPEFFCTGIHRHYQKLNLTLHKTGAYHVDKR